MVVDNLGDERIDQVFRALADTTRRDIVSRTLGTELSVTTLARSYAMSFAAVQKHVAVLERAGLVTKVRRGREQLVRCDIETVRRAHRLLGELEDLWRARMDRFGEALVAADAPTTDDPDTDDEGVAS